MPDDAKPGSPSGSPPSSGPAPSVGASRAGTGPDPASPVPARPGLREAGAAFSVPEFKRFWIGALISNSGSWMQNISVPFVLYELTGSAVWVGVASFAQFIPAVLMGPLGGSFADRFPRRRVLIIAQVAMAVIAIGLWALWASGGATRWSVTACIAMLGAVSGLQIGSWQAFVSELVPRHLLLNAVTLNSAQFNGARAFGPALGGFVLAGLGPSGAFAINAASKIAVLIALWSIAPKPAAAPTAPATASWARRRKRLATCATRPVSGRA